MKNGQVWFSKSNQCAVRIVRIDQHSKSAIIRHHDAEMIQNNVMFKDLIPATKEQIKQYHTR
tara:strand:+ start:264 stop:449 length:186 start_codon:yes stop_codon:yes gene_type:complete